MGVHTLIKCGKCINYSLSDIRNGIQMLFDHMHTAHEENGVNPAFVLHILSLIILSLFMVEVSKVRFSLKTKLQMGKAGSGTLFLLIKILYHAINN